MSRYKHAMASVTLLRDRLPAPRVHLAGGQSAAFFFCRYRALAAPLSASYRPEVASPREGRVVAPLPFASLPGGRRAGALKRASLLPLSAAGGATANSHPRHGSGGRAMAMAGRAAPLSAAAARARGSWGARLDGWPAAHAPSHAAVFDGAVLTRPTSRVGEGCGGCEHRALPTARVVKRSQSGIVVYRGRQQLAFSSTLVSPLPCLPLYLIPPLALPRRGHGLLRQSRRSRQSRQARQSTSRSRCGGIGGGGGGGGCIAC